MKSAETGAPLHPQELPEGFDPTADPMELSLQLQEEITSPINTVLNERIGHELQAADAKKLEDPLIQAQDLARLSDEISRYEAGQTTELSDAAKEAIKKGETPMSILESAFTARDTYVAAKAEKEDDLDFNEKLDDTRTTYVKTLMSRPRIRGRKQHKADLEAAEAAYNEAFIDKVTQIMKLDPYHRKNPYSSKIGEKLQQENPDAKDIAGNQLHVLVDQLAREQLNKTAEIDQLSNRGVKRVLRALTTSRSLRVAIGGAIWAGSMVATNKGLLPHGAESIGDAADKVLPLVAGYFTSREVMTGVDEGIAKLQRGHRLKKDVRALTSDTFLADQAMRTIYSGIEYQDGLIKERRAGTTPEEHKQAFQNINSQFAKLAREGARGGKPYSAEQVLPYVAELYVRRKDQVDAITTADDPNKVFLGLCREVITADTKELTDKQQENRGKRAAFRALAVASTVFAGQWMGQIRDFQEMSQRPGKMVAADAV